MNTRRHSSHKPVARVKSHSFANQGPVTFLEWLVEPPPPEGALLYAAAEPVADGPIPYFHDDQLVRLGHGNLSATMYASDWHALAARMAGFNVMRPSQHGEEPKLLQSFDTAEEAQEWVDGLDADDAAYLPYVDEVRTLIG